ncbi:MAG: rubrerythrin family protein [Ignavibacteria bacterium]|nr:rubrerythrin family protein [Ignavibacteria bacterium]
MKDELSQLLDEFIHLEINVAEIYNIFHYTFPEDDDFWWRLHLEESNHAALIKSAKDVFVPVGKFPSEFLSVSLEDLRDSNTELFNIVKKYKDTRVSRDVAFNIALQLENTKGERHYQRFMNKKSDTKLDEIFQRLNNDEKNHALRISSYMIDHGIEIQEKKTL